MYEINDNYLTGWPALTWAAAFGHTDSVRLLLENPTIDINAETNRGKIDFYIITKPIMGIKDISEGRLKTFFIKT